MIPTTLKAYYKPKLFTFFQTRHGWMQAISDSIDWTSSTSAYKHLSYGRKLAMFKLINGQWPTNKILRRRGKAPTSLCPRCSNAVEDHNLTCSASCHFRDTKWTTLSDHLKSKLALLPRFSLPLPMVSNCGKMATFPHFGLFQTPLQLTLFFGLPIRHMSKKQL